MSRSHLHLKPETFGIGTLALIALAALTLIRLAVAALAPLSPDEAYYWVWSRDLQAGYLDAPPMVALWIRAGTAIVGPGALGVRLLGPFAAAVGSCLLWDAGEVLLPGRNAGLVAAGLFNATLFVGVGAVIMTPDAPLLFFWVCGFWASARFVHTRNGAWLVAAGVFAGLALASKYTAVLFVVGIGLCLLLTPMLRQWLLRPAPWLGALCGALLFAPIVAWNATHRWASFVKQGGRIGDWQPAKAVRFLGELVGGQAGLATPLVFLLCVAGVILAARLAWRRRDPTPTLLAALTLPGTALFVQHAFGDRVQGNWPAVIYPAAVIAAAGLDARFWQRLHGPAIGLGLGITALVYVQALASVVPLPARLDPITRQLAGWPRLAAQVDAMRDRIGGNFVASDQYGEAAKLARELPASIPVIGVEPRWAFFTLPRPAFTGEVGVLVRTERRGNDIDRAPWAAIQPIGEAIRSRDGSVIERFRLYRVVARVGTAQTALLPRP